MPTVVPSLGLSLNGRFTWPVILAAALVILWAPAAPAQSMEAGPDPSIDGQFNVRGTVGVPRGGFGDNVEGGGGGLNVFFGGRPAAGWPLVLGLDGGFLIYGRSTDTVPFSQTVGPRVPVEVETNNNIAQAHLALRLQPTDGRLRPFVEALGGFKYLFTRTSVNEEDDGDDEVASSVNFDDFALSGGVGGGVDLRVWRAAKPEQTARTLSLHFGVQYLVGQEAEYLAEGGLTDDNGNGRLDAEELDVRRSRTTLLQPQFGLTIQFDSDGR